MRRLLAAQSQLCINASCLAVRCVLRIENGTASCPDYSRRGRPLEPHNRAWFARGCSATAVRPRPGSCREGTTSSSANLKLSFLPISQAHPGAPAVLVNKFYTGQLKRLSKHHTSRVTRLRCLTLKYPNRRHANPGSVSEFLLGPVKKAARRSTLRSGNHGYEESDRPSRVNSIVFRLTCCSIDFILL